jgi:hypothetical protein
MPVGGEPGRTPAGAPFPGPARWRSAAPVGNNRPHGYNCGGDSRQRHRREGGAATRFRSGEEVQMKWVTRAGVKVDRVACPWLIRHFVDPDAEFLFVEPNQVMTVAAAEDAIPFDVSGVELGHHGPECSFDAIVTKYQIADPAVRKLALIVRGADTDDKDVAPESRGLEAIAEGFRRMGLADDYAINAREWIVYDALYLYCGGDPARIGGSKGEDEGG